MAQKVVIVDETTGGLKQLTPNVASAGVSDAGKVIALDGTGKLDSSFLPAGLEVSALSVVMGEALTAGMVCYLADNAGTPNVKKANATDNTKKAMGFINDTPSYPGSATIFMFGVCALVPKGSMTAADVNKPVFLSTTGGAVTLTPPVAAGNLLQPVGRLLSVGATYASIDFDFSDNGVTM